MATTDSSNDTSAMPAMKDSESIREVKTTLKQRIVRALRDTISGTRPECLVELKDIEETAQKCNECLEETGLEGCTVRAKCPSFDYNELVDRDFGLHRVRGAK